MPPDGRPPDWLSSQPPIAPLARQLRAGRVVPFVGAGTSIGLGLPSWPRLVESLRQAAQREAGGAPQGMPKDPLLAAELCRRRLGARYGDVLSGAFTLGADHKAAIDRSEVFERLAALPCVFWLTTNYDAAIEHALSRFRPRSRPESFSWSHEGAVNRFLMRRHDRRSRPAVIHLHGRVSEPEDVVLTEEDYQRRYWWAGTDRLRIATFFATYSALFVGCSMTDEDLKSVLREVKARFRFSGGQHFWLRGVVDEAEWGRTGDREAHAALWRSKFGVDVIDYPAPGHDHRELAVAIAAIGALAETPAGRYGAAGRGHRRGAADPATDPGDPRKGRFGGEASRGGYSLRARVSPVDRRASWFGVRLEVVREGGAEAPRAVTFHVHDSFTPDAIEAAFEGDRATLDLEAFGAFTVGATVRLASGARVQLELDLATVRDAPAGFRDG